jgi:aspartate aminotransferase, cytoplasmic
VRCYITLQVDLTLGAYRDESGAPWPLPSVRAAERQLLDDTTANHEYLPIDGSPAFQVHAIIAS